MEGSNSEETDLKSRRNIFALGFVSFFTDVSSEMVFSLLPTFILGLSGSSRVMLGLIEGAAEALSYGMRAISGIFSDKFRKRKSLILVGYGLSNLVKPLFSVAASAIDVAVVRITDRLGKGIRTAPRDALIAESVSEKRRGAAFGLHRTLDQAGAVTGPLLASSLLLLGFTATDVFMASLVPGLIALLIIVFLVKERVGKSMGEFKLLVGLRTVLTGRFALLLTIVTLFSLGAFNFSFVLLNAKESLVPDQLIPVVYAIVNLFHVAIAVPSGLLADRIGKEKVLITGYGAFFATAISIFLWSGNFHVAFLIAAFYGVYDGIANTVTRALIPNYAESGLKGTAYGIYYLTVGTAFFISNTIVGTLWQYYGSNIATLYSMALAATGTVGMMAFTTRQSQED